MTTPLNRSQLLTEIAASMPDNTSGLITPAIMRGVLSDMIDNVWTLFDTNIPTGITAFAVPPIFTGLSGLLVGNGGSPATALAAGQIPGSATNDSASSGNIGEFVTATVTNLALTTATPTTIASITLSAGDWDVWGDIYFNPAGTTTLTAFAAASSDTSGVFSASPPTGGLNQISGTFTTGAPASLPVGVQRYSLGGSTIIYLVGQASFGTSTLTATGKISARRAR